MGIFFKTEQHDEAYFHRFAATCDGRDERKLFLPFVEEPPDELFGICRVPPWPDKIAHKMLLRLGHLSYRLRTAQHFMTASACKWYLEHARKAIQEKQTIEIFTRSIWSSATVWVHFLPDAALPAINAMMDRLQALLDDHVARWGAVNTTDFGRYADSAPDRVLYGNNFHWFAPRGTPFGDLASILDDYCWMQSHQ